MRSHCVVALLLAAATSPAARPGLPPLDASTIARIDAFVAEHTADSGIPGVAMRRRRSSASSWLETSVFCGRCAASGGRVGSTGVLGRAGATGAARGAGVGVATRRGGSLSDSE